MWCGIQIDHKSNLLLIHCSDCGIQFNREVVSCRIQTLIKSQCVQGSARYKVFLKSHQHQVAIFSNQLGLGRNESNGIDFQLYDRDFKHLTIGQFIDVRLRIRKVPASPGFREKPTVEFLYFFTGNRPIDRFFPIVLNFLAEVIAFDLDAEQLLNGFIFLDFENINIGQRFDFGRSGWQLAQRLIDALLNGSGKGLC